MNRDNPAGRLARWEWALLAAGLLIRTALGLWSIRAQSATFDEPTYLAAGVAAWREGDHGVMGYWHPPLSFLLAGALPTLLGADVLREHPSWSVPDWRDPVRQYAYGNDALAGHPRWTPDHLMTLARLTMLELSLLLPLLVFQAARAIGGPAAGAAAFFMSIFCPALTAHGAIAATDGVLALFFFMAFWALWHWDQLQKPGWAAAAGAAFGLAVCSKVTTLAFLPAPFLWIAARSGRRGRDLALCAGAMAACVLAVYRVDQTPFLWEAFRTAMRYAEEGRRSFFLDGISTRGTWAYFPAAFLLKTPLATLLAIPWAGAIFWRRRLRLPALLWAPAAAYFLMACLYPVQIGHRHILPVYPFLYVFLGMGLAAAMEKRGGRTLGGALALWSAAAAFAAAPYPLAYFNEAAGGADKGYRHLTDSNVDWGQGLKALKIYLGREGVADIYLSYFGSVDPAHYGIRSVEVAPANFVKAADVGADPLKERRQLLVVSATNLQGTYFADPQIFAWLRGRRPEARLAHSLFVYDVTSDPAAHRWLAGGFRRTGRPEAAGREEALAAALESGGV